MGSLDLSPSLWGWAIHSCLNLLDLPFPRDLRKEHEVERDSQSQQRGQPRHVGVKWQGQTTAIHLV